MEAVVSATADELAGWNEVVVKPYVMVRIPNLAVDQAPRGRCIGRKLIGYALEYFRCEGLTL